MTTDGDRPSKMGFLRCSLRPQGVVTAVYSQSTSIVSAKLKVVNRIQQRRNTTVQWSEHTAQHKSSPEYEATVSLGVRVDK